MRQFRKQVDAGSIAWAKGDEEMEIGEVCVEPDPENP